jgi:hypothetical protein
MDLAVQGPRAKDGGRWKRQARVALLFADGDGVAQVHGAATLADIVAVPGGNLYINITLDDALAAEARSQGQTRSHVETVGLVIVHLRQVFHTVFNDDVAGGARTIAAASVLELDAEIQTNVEKRFRFPVLVIRQLAGFEFYRLTVDGDLGQIPL